MRDFGPVFLLQLMSNRQRTTTLVVCALCAFYLLFSSAGVERVKAISSACEPVMVYEGSQYGGWWYDSRAVSTSTIVYSFGLGEDTSWDEAILERGGTVYGFDPTPKSIEYVSERRELWTRKGQFRHLTIGLSTRKGTVEFTKPLNPDHVSMRQGSHEHMGNIIRVDVDSLKNLLLRNGHTHIDILKIDVESSEYDILEDLIQERFFPFSQLLIEFHDVNQEKYKKRLHGILVGLALNGFAVTKNKAMTEMSFERIYS